MAVWQYAAGGDPTATEYLIRMAAERAEKQAAGWVSALGRTLWGAGKAVGKSLTGPTAKEMAINHGPTAGIFLGIPAVGGWLASRRQQSASDRANQLVTHATTGDEAGFHNWVRQQKFSPAQQQAMQGLWQDPQARAQMSNQRYAIDVLGNLQQFSRQPNMTPELLQQTVSNQLKMGFDESDRVALTRNQLGGLATESADAVRFHDARLGQWLSRKIPPLAEDVWHGAKGLVLDPDGRKMLAVAGGTGLGAALLQRYLTRKKEEGPSSLKDRVKRNLGTGLAGLAGAGLGAGGLIAAINTGVLKSGSAPTDVTMTMGPVVPGDKKMTQRAYQSQRLGSNSSAVSLTPAQAKLAMDQASPPSRRKRRLGLGLAGLGGAGLGTAGLLALLHAQQGGSGGGGGEEGLLGGGELPGAPSISLKPEVWPSLSEEEGQHYDTGLPEGLDPREERMLSDRRLGGGEDDAYQKRKGALTALLGKQSSVTPAMLMCLAAPTSPAGYLLKAALADELPRELRVRDALQGRREFSSKERKDIEEGKSRWLPEMLQADDTRLPDMLASPERQGAIGAAVGALLGSPYGAGGAVAGGVTGGLGLLLYRYLKNRNVIERMTRLPEDARRYDLHRTNNSPFADSGGLGGMAAALHAAKYGSVQKQATPVIPPGAIAAAQQMAAKPDYFEAPPWEQARESVLPPDVSLKSGPSSEGGTDLTPYLIGGGGGLAALAAAALLAHRSKQKKKRQLPA